MTDARYPIGPFVYHPGNAQDRVQHIARIASLPSRLRQIVTGLDESGLKRTYREGSWTVRQLLHHLPDSHMNGYIRFKLALTEDTPTIKPYDEQRWADMVDVHEIPVEVSLSLLDAVHVRWSSVLRAMTEADFARRYMHPEHGREFTLDESLASYAWHGDHHLSHIERALRVEA